MKSNNARQSSLVDFFKKASPLNSPLKRKPDDSETTEEISTKKAKFDREIIEDIEEVI
jgi:hypothetical protein